MSFIVPSIMLHWREQIERDNAERKRLLAAAGVDEAMEQELMGDDTSDSSLSAAFAAAELHNTVMASNLARSEQLGRALERGELFAVRDYVRASQRKPSLRERLGFGR